MDEQIMHLNEPAPGIHAPDYGNPGRGRRLLVRSLLARRTAWRRRVVVSMFAALAALAASHLAFAEYAAAAPATTITQGGLR